MSSYPSDSLNNSEIFKGKIFTFLNLISKNDLLLKYNNNYDDSPNIEKVNCKTIPITIPIIEFHRKIHLFFMLFIFIPNFYYCR